MTVGNVTTLNSLPPALALNGSELSFIYQFNPLTGTWITYRCTTAQIASIFNSSGSGWGPGVCSMRQLCSALQSDGVLYTAVTGISADPTDTYNIAWNHAYRMSITDPFVTGYLQPTIGYTNGQMVALFALALTFPI